MALIIFPKKGERPCRCGSSSGHESYKALGRTTSWQSRAQVTGTPALVGRCFQNLCPPPRQPQRAEAGLSIKGWEGKGLLPANHLPVPVHGDVGPGPVVKRSKVTVGGSKPLIKSVPQGVELRPVAQMPRNRNPGHFTEPHMGTPQSSEQNTPSTSQNI